LEIRFHKRQDSLILIVKTVKRKCGISHADICRLRVWEG